MDIGRLLGGVAHRVLGEHNARLSSGNELRFGKHGSLSVDLELGTWYDHEHQTGGGVLDLIRDRIGLSGREAYDWISQQGLGSVVDDVGGGNGSAAASSPSPRPALNIIATYDYVDEDGTLIKQVLRFDPKEFRQRRPDPEHKGRWLWKLGGVREVPYGLPRVAEAIAQEHTIVIVEGEKAADELAKLGIIATCNAGGAGKWKPEHTSFFRDADVVILPDNDDAGRHHADAVAHALFGVARRLRLVALPGLPEKGDAYDWIKAGGTAERLWRLFGESAEWSPAPKEPTVVVPLRAPAATTASLLPSILTIAQVVIQFIPPDYVVDGILQRGYVYALTGKTGSGKTAVALAIATAVAQGLSLGSLEVAKGKVLYLAGENPDDTIMRCNGIQHFYQLDLEQIGIYLILGKFKLSACLDELRRRVESQIGELALVVVDTSQAFFEGDDWNNNVQALQYASMMRQLASLPGRPAVVTNSHPKKGAAETDLVPYGGGAFVNEVDTNLTCIKRDAVAELYWDYKIRGPDFAPIAFKLGEVTTDTLKTSKGRTIPSVVATHLSDQAQEDMASAGNQRQDKLLVTMLNNPGASVKDLAVLLQWSTRDGKPYKSMVHRTIERLRGDKLIADERGRAVLTPKGKGVAEELRQKG